MTTFDEWVHELSMVIAEARFGKGLDMGGAHNPRPSEVKAARYFLEAYEIDRQTLAPSSKKVGPEELRAYIAQRESGVGE